MQFKLYVLEVQIYFKNRLISKINHHIFQPFLRNLWHIHFVSGIANGQEQKRAFVVGAVEDIFQKIHGRRRVREGRQARLVDCRNQKPASDANGFLHVIMFFFFWSRGLGKHDYQPRGSFQKWFPPIRSQRREVFEPLFGHSTVVAVVFFLLGSGSNLLFY